MPIPSPRRLAGLLLLTAAGCSSSKPTSAPTPTPQVTAAPTVQPGGADPTTPAAIRGSAPAPSRNRDRTTLSREEILATQYTNLYDVILSLRGNWLRQRTAETINGKSSMVQVYLDTQRLSGVDELRTMQSSNIESVKFFDPIQASARWGMDHGAGAIFIVTAKR